ncbi:MAG: helix-turn-helix domain-containing protein [Candidatus Micrarchaeota archaeon]
MELTKREAKILEFLMQQDVVTQSELALELKIKKSNMSKYLKSLLEAGLVSIIHRGGVNHIKISQTLFSEYNRLRNPILERLVVEVMIGKNPYLLSYFQEKKFTTKNMLMPAASAKRALAKLRAFGIAFMNKKGIYEIRQEIRPLSEFCTNLLYTMHLEHAKKVFHITSSFFISKAPNGWAILLVSTSAPNTKDYFPTAYDVFGEYGIRLILTERHYYTNIRPKLEDIIIHTLVISTGGLSEPWLDTRGITYSCALIIKTRTDYKKLVSVRHKFGLDDQSLRNVIDFVESKGAKTFPGFPSWQEVECVLNG